MASKKPKPYLNNIFGEVPAVDDPASRQGPHREDDLKRKEVPITPSMFQRDGMDMLYDDMVDEDESVEKKFVNVKQEDSVEPATVRGNSVLDGLDEDEVEDEEDPGSVHRSERREKRSTFTKAVPGSLKESERYGSSLHSSKSIRQSLDEKKFDDFDAEDEYGKDMVHPGKPRNRGESTRNRGGPPLKYNLLGDPVPKVPSSGEDFVVREDDYFNSDAMTNTKSYVEEGQHGKPKSAYEEVLQAGKASRRPRMKELDPAQVDEECIAFLDRMMHARDEDVRCYKNGLPALSKLKMLREVEGMMTKVVYRESLMENMVLAIFKTWLDPMSDGVLPNVQVRTTILNILKTIRVDYDWVEKLENSQGLGRVVHFLSRNEENMSNRRIAERLITKWARPVYQSNADFRDILEEFDKPDDGVKGPDNGIVSNRRAAQETVKYFQTTREKLDEFRTGKGEGKSRDQNFVDAPRPSALLYTALPASSDRPVKKIAKKPRTEGSVNRRVSRTLTTMRRLNKKRSVRAFKPSVNGR